MVGAPNQRGHGQSVQEAEKEDQAKCAPNTGLAEDYGQSENSGTDHALHEVHQRQMGPFCRRRFEC